MNIGIDMVLITRFDKIKNDTDRMNKIFTNEELQYILKTNYNSATMAGIFASKEAFFKSIKKGINNYSIKDIEILHNKNNAPYVKLHNSLFNDFANKSFDVSISHDGDYAIAIVISF